MADLFSNIYNPDVLSCLANLSNDEVFTPPAIANQMLDLLPQELFEDPSTTFLDPCCKSGVFLREIAKRLIVGLEERIPDLQERLDHIYHKQLFGIAITELTSLLSRRSVYCSKYASSKYSVSHFDNIDGNIRFKRIEHTWNDNKCIYCGASKNVQDRGEARETHAYEFIHKLNLKDFNNMKFDVIIGNPPYQLDDGGAQASAMPIYNLFVDKAKKLNPRYLTMIIPARWYTGGKNLNDFRKDMLNDSRIKVIHDFENASECFSGVEIKGGVCYFLWKRDSTPSDCKVIEHKNNQIVSERIRPLLEKDCDVFIRYNEAIDILKKIKKYKEKTFDRIVYSAMTFGLRTFFKEFDSDVYKPGLVKIYANHSQGYIQKNNIPKGHEFIDKWKVFIPEAIGSGTMATDVINPILGEPNSIGTETYVMNGPYKDENEAKNVITYINTKFFHFMLGVKKNTQHTTQKVYGFIPIQDFSRPWTDNELYAKYSLSEKEISFIEKMVRPNDTNGEDDE